MSEAESFAGAIPEIYDRLLVPLLFEPYAADLADRVARFAPTAVLETATGTGVVPRALAPRLDEGATYVASDLSQAMLDRARSRQPDARVSWRQADANALPFADARFDAVCCQFGAMFLPDRVAGFQEARRVLRDGGRYFFSVWDRIEANAFAETISGAVAACFPSDPPSFLARIPHGYHAVDRIHADVAAAGFGTIEIETVAHESVATDPETAAVAFCQGTPLRGEIEARGTVSLSEVTRRAARALEERFGAGRVAGRMQAHVVVATR
jgi:SAM-dependent methyltransferase